MEPTTTNTGRSASAIVALVLAIIGLLLSAVPIINNFAFVLAAVAIVLGIVAIVKTGKSGKKGRTMAIVSVVLAVLTVVIVLSTQKLYVDTLNTATQELEQTSNDASGDNTEEILGRDVDVTLGEFAATEGEFMTETSLPVTVVNKLTEAKSYSIQVAAEDASGNKIADDYINANNLGAKQTQEFKLFQYVESDKVEAMKTATFKVVSVSKF